MAEDVGVLLVAYGSRACAIAEALKRSEEYDVHLFIADRQRNPFNMKIAEKHAVIPDLSVEKICEFAEKHRNDIDFGICCPEKPIIEGIRDEIEARVGIKMICPTKEYALEASKIRQRLLIEAVCKDANPEFRVFRREDYTSSGGRLDFDALKGDLFAALDDFNDEVAVKPDRPAAGKGVGVWGDHFSSREELWEHFISIFKGGSDVVVEEKLLGEESSFQAFCDGSRIVPLPETRDYKRAFDGDLGENTGGMGSYKDKGEILPFMRKSDREAEERIVERIFKKLKGDGRNEGLIGMPFYVAFMHTADGAKILEINSRPGDPEIQNIMPILRDDFVEVCFRMLEGTLKRLECDEKATVVTYAVPMTYGGYRKKFSGSKRVDLSEAYKLREKYGDALRIYPGSLELREDGNTYALSSRTVCAVGIADSLEDARKISLDAIRSIDGPLWNRWDIASPHHIQKSIQRMKELRSKGAK